MKVCIRCKGKNEVWNAPGQFVTSDLHRAAYNQEPDFETGAEDEICYYCQRRELDLIEQGYTEVLPLKGNFGYTELGIHCRLAHLQAIMARRNPAYPCSAYILTEDGRWTSGSFYYRDEETFSLS